MRTLELDLFERNSELYINVDRNEIIYNVRASTSFAEIPECHVRSCIYEI
jgi:hypothetical protein